MIQNVKKNFAAAKACHHGGKVRAMASILDVDQRDLLDFSANINPLGSPPLKNLIREEMENIGHYPDNEYMEFRRAAADFVGVDVNNVVPGNGSSELFRLFAEMIIEEGDLVLITVPTFGEYETQSRLFGARIKYVDRGVRVPKNPSDFLDDSTLKKAKAVFLCNPNNPTGTLISRNQIEKLAQRCERSETFLLVDEAFIELSDPRQSVAQMAPQMEFLFVCRSLTKSFGVPGLRLGFGIAGDCMAEVMNQTRLPWSISSLASAVGTHLLKQTDHLEKSREEISRELYWLTTELRSLGLEPINSTVNFILVNVKSSGYRSAELAEKMICQKVLIRDCQSFPGLGDDYIRVAVRNREENKKLIKALRRVMGCAE